MIDFTIFAGRVSSDHRRDQYELPLSRALLLFVRTIKSKYTRIVNVWERRILLKVDGEPDEHTLITGSKREMRLLYRVAVCYEAIERAVQGNVDSQFQIFRSGQGAIFIAAGVLPSLLQAAGSDIALAIFLAMEVVDRESISGSLIRTSERSDAIDELVRIAAYAHVRNQSFAELVRDPSKVA